MLRERVAPPDFFAAGFLRAGFLAAPLLFAADVRLAPDAADLAGAGVLRVVDALRVPDAFFRVPVDLRVVVFAPLEDDAELGPLPALAPPSIDHLPDITRCAASATASAMIEPSLVALDMTLLAACDALSAASRPASRILRRAAGLALIAAAAAARPAASISLLIAALASLSIVSLERELPELFFEALAIT